MKANRFFAILAAASMVAVASCNKEPNPKPDPEKPDPEKPDPVVLKTEANLISVVAVINGEEEKATIYKNDKVAEFIYLPELESLYRSATLKVTVSEGAKINLQADQPYDLVAKVALEITSEDGKTTNKFSIEAVPAQVKIACQPVWDGGFKTAGAAGLPRVSMNGVSVAFCGTDKFVYLDGTVVDFNCNKVGQLNLDGTLAAGGEAHIYALDNDVNGVVIAQVRTELLEEVTACEFYAWVNGYDKAPVKFLVPEVPFGSSGFRFFSVGGDVNGKFILTAVTGGRGATTMHHVYEYPSGITGEPVWHAFNTPYVSNDGCWAQSITPVSGNIDDTFFIADSNGENRGYHLYARQGIEDSGDTVLYGTVWEDGLAEAPAEGDEFNHEYGNFSLGAARGFQYSGVDYVAAFTTGWPCTYLTIQTANPDDEDHYLLRSQKFDGCSQAAPSGAYIYNPATDKGYIVMVTGEYSAGTPYGVALYEISREIY